MKQGNFLSFVIFTILLGIVADATTIIITAATGARITEYR